ncbi:MAG: hemerythrin domain-containing protein [Rhodomicrobium sp.]
MTVPIPEIPNSLLARPLDYLLADHFSQRQLLTIITRLREDCTDWREAAKIAVDYLETAMPLHYADEETGLFPTLEDRCLPEDGLEALLTRLRAEHIEGDRSARRIMRDLRKCLRLDTQPHAHPKLPDRIASFVKLGRLHLALENAVLIPIARVRLKSRDLIRLSESMRLRRSNPSTFP